MRPARKARQPRILAIFEGGATSRAGTQRRPTAKLFKRHYTRDGNRTAQLMKSVWNDRDRRDLDARISKLSRDRAPQWGKMTAPQMVAHLADALRMAAGDLSCKPKNLPIRYPPLKQLIIYALPFPKGAPTAPELLARAPGEWPVEMSELRTLLDQFATRGPGATAPEHPAFGKMTGKSWGVLVYRHTDHHLRQFGV